MSATQSGYDMRVSQKLAAIQMLRTSNVWMDGAMDGEDEDMVDMVRTVKSALRNMIDDRRAK